MRAVLTIQIDLNYLDPAYTYEMQKDFKEWFGEKERINAAPGKALFHEREVWWCALGTNIGDEQDGGRNYMRPVVILKKFNLNACLVLPLTGRLKQGKYYFPIGKIEDREGTAILSQLRFVDRKRLANKMGVLGEDTFKSLIHAIVNVNFSL